MILVTLNMKVLEANNILKHVYLMKRTLEKASIIQFQIKIPSIYAECYYK